MRSRKVLYEGSLQRVNKLLTSNSVTLFKTNKLKYRISDVLDQVLVLLLFLVKAWLNNGSEISDTLLQLRRFSAIKYMKQNKSLS